MRYGNYNYSNQNVVVAVKRNTRVSLLTDEAIKAPNQIDLILYHSLTIVRELHFGKMLC
jgi:hypothetical protein